MEIKIGDWVKVIRKNHLAQENVIFGEVCALGIYQNKPIATILVQDEKFLTICTELVTEIRNSYKEIK